MKTDRKAYRHEWYLKNKNKILDRVHKYYQDHKTDEVERSKRYYREHREEALAKIKAYQAARLSEIHERNKKYYQEHREELKAKRLLGAAPEEDLAGEQVNDGNRQHIADGAHGDGRRG